MEDVDLSGVSELKQMLAEIYASGRRVLLEHEVYRVLELAGLPVPRWRYLPFGEEVTEATLEGFQGERIVAKVVSPLILHKSDVGGVKILPLELQAVTHGVRSMEQSIPAACAEFMRMHNSDQVPAEDEIRASIGGILLAEFVPYNTDFGNELILGVRWSREFGPVLNFGVGGTDAEYYASRMLPGRSHALRSVMLLDRPGVLQMLQQTAVYERLSGNTRGSRRQIEDDTLLDAIEGFVRLAKMLTPFEEDAPCLLEELEINPLVVADGRLLPLDGLMRLAALPDEVHSRNVSRIGNLLHAESVALVGVSQKMNPGRIILQNLLDADFDTERIHIVKPNADEIAGVRCYPCYTDLPEQVDTLVLAIAAEQVPEALQEICASDCARSVVVIPGGIAEKEGGEVIQRQIDEIMEKARTLPEGGPVIVGSNCLGIYARDAGVNNIFIPEYKLPKPSGGRSRIAYLSQSGAFMICRMSCITSLDPVYSVSLGNQMHLTIGDFVEHLRDDPEVDLLACYVEGFQDLDGLKLASLAADLHTRGKRLLLYKAGRTAEGKSASAGHTASIAGDFETCRQLLKAAGVIMLDTFADFQNAVRIEHAASRAKPILKGRTPRIGVISNAGFECVGIADNVKRRVYHDEIHMDLARFTPETNARLQEALCKGRIDGLVDVHNPLDVTPMASDLVWAECCRAILEDPNVDAAILSPVPLTAAMQTLAPAAHHRENLAHADAVCTQFIELQKTCGKPFVVSIDSGRLFDPLAQALEDAGLPVFRYADEATRALGAWFGSIDT